MERATIEEQLDKQVTRRRIVKTGVRLAYAAPLVAATFKLSESALAQQGSAPGCKGGNCATAGQCNDNRLCVCFEVGPNTGFCHKCQKCRTAPKCPGGQAQCDALHNGSVCSTNNCCNTAVCLQPCAKGVLSDCVRPPAEAQVRTYEVASLGGAGAAAAPARHEILHPCEEGEMQTVCW